jgi:hypothetical protein
MSRTRSRNLDEPDESLAFDHGKVDWVVIADQTVGRTIHEPGWRWSTHIRPIVGGDWCQSRHVGAVISGRMHVITDDGDEFDVGPYDVIDVAPGHDAWVVGDDPVIQVEWSGVRGWLEPLESLNERVLATVVVTDIVDSTGHATRLGGSRWNDLLARHNSRMRDVVTTFRGREIKTRAMGFWSSSTARRGRSAAPRGWRIRHARTGSRSGPRSILGRLSSSATTCSA